MVIAQAVGDKAEKKKFSTNCRFCDALFWSDECTKYTTAKTRKQRIKGSCYICLKQGHIINDCPKRIPCFHYGKWNHHHRSLRTQKFGTVHREQANLAEDQSSQDEVLKIETSRISSGEMVLMQTVRADINNPDNDFKQNTRMLLDSGSQRTYITESSARKMNLEIWKREIITLVTFGSETSKNVQTPTTKLDIVFKDGSTLNIRAYVVAQTAGSIQRCPVNLESLKTWEYLWTEFSLANLPSEQETSSAELLIGNEYYLDIILPQRIEIQLGLYVLSSKLGWTLSGRISETVHSAGQYNTSLTRPKRRATNMAKQRIMER